MKHWLWVTRPDYYLSDEDFDIIEKSNGNLTDDDIKSFKGRDLLEPDYGDVGWWSCNKDVREGDIILLYRSILYRDIKYIMTAVSDAYDISGDNEMGWKYGCEFRSLIKLENSITIENLREHDYLKNWGVLKSQFRQKSFSIKDEDWNQLISFIKTKNDIPDFNSEKKVDKILEKNSSPDGFVYLLKSKQYPDTYKIGKCSNIDRRLKELKKDYRYNVFDLELVSCVETEHKDSTEVKLHKMFDSYRIKSCRVELFRSLPSDVEKNFEKYVKIK